MLSEQENRWVLWILGEGDMKSIRDYPIQIKFERPPALSGSDRCAIDTEWFHMDISRAHRPTLIDGSPNGFFACATFCFDGETVYFITDPKDLQQALDNVNEAVWIFANFRFDITHMRRHATIPVRTRKIWDVLTAERILYSGYYNDFTLADVTRRRLGVYVPKEERGGFEKADKLTDELIQYAAYDPIATWHSYQHQRKEVSKNDLKLWAEVDLPGTNTIMSMSGFMVDRPAYQVLVDEALGKREALQNKYPEINLNSTTHQVAPILVKRGYKLPKTPGGNYSASIKVLEKIEEPDEFVQDLIAYSGLKSLATTYGQSIIDKIELDGRIYADFQNNGAGTGRWSCREPNLQNIPNKYTDPRYRDCFVAAPGNVLIIGDWSSQEPRIYAYLTQDGKLVEIFNNDLDVYIEAARLMYGWELTKKDPRRNKPMKPTVLGACYGLTGYGMEEQYGIPIEEGQAHIDAFFSVFTQARDWNEAQRKRTDYVETVLGRKFWLNPYDWKSKNNSLNSPVQGSASDAMKMAAWCFCEEWRATEKSPIVNVVHDEIILEVAETAKESAIECLRMCMEDVAQKIHPGIKGKADIGWGYNWNSKV